ncbi:hypothetical protein BZZ01_20170 [Nostocales cyanobacterium HT-58-2]|nr:hypothetical protein BZZ01_20170 [Nostocales cyanobacterium HT-58-2]
MTVNSNWLSESIVRQRFEIIAENYDQTIGKRREVYNQAVDNIVLDALQSYPSPVILDAGCGTATRPAKLKCLLPKARICGVDASHNMIEIAQTRGLDEVRVCRLEDIDYPDQTFDVVTCLFFVICHMSSEAERSRAIANLYRVLKPGGLLFIDAINTWHLGEGLAFRRTILEALWDYIWSILDPRLAPGDKIYSTEHNGRRLRGFFHSFTHHSLSRLLEKEKFTIEQKYTLGYNSGLLHHHSFKGQLLQICRRPLEG